MSLGRFLRLYETTIILKGDNVVGFNPEGGLNHDVFNVNTGSRLVMSLYVEQIDAGATATVTIKNRFSQDVPFQPVMQWGATAVGYTTRVITDFHNLFDAEIVVTGGNAKAWLAVTVFDNALATRIENAVIEAALSHIAGIDGKFDSVRIGDGVDLLEIINGGIIVSGVGQTPEERLKHRLLCSPDLEKNFTFVNVDGIQRVSVIVFTSASLDAETGDTNVLTRTFTYLLVDPFTLSKVKDNLTVT